MSKRVFTTSRSEFSEKFLHLDGAPFSLDDYHFMRVIYDIDSFEKTLKTSRQISKSTTLANILVSNSIIMPLSSDNFRGGFRSIYVSPTVDQSKVWSHDRLTPIIEGSPFIRDNFVNTSLIQNVFHKQFINGSKIYIRYSYLHADRVRGLSADMNVMDETQDLILDNIEIIQQTMSRSHYKHSVYAGTPKRTIGSLAKKWSESTRNEWFVKCEHCGKYNYLDEKNIQPQFLGCRYCYKQIFPKNGLWVRTNNDSHKDEHDNFLNEGFRISILMFAYAPWVNWNRDVVHAYETKSESIFQNEYLGLEFDDGVAPITMDELRACCTGGPMLDSPDSLSSSYASALGIDWGPMGSRNSYTVRAVVQRRGNITHVLHLKKYKGKEADYGHLHEEIPRDKIKWGAKLIGADYGFGESANSEISKRIKDPIQLIQFQHLGNQKQQMLWNENMKAYTLGRNKVMTGLFQKIKRREIVFPDWEYFEPFAKDFLAIQIDYDEVKGKMKYVNSEPDDAFHAVLYGDIAAFLHRQASA